MTKRKNETEVEKLARQAKDRDHKRLKFSSETEEEKLARQAKQREKRRQKQVSETEEEKLARRAKQREYQNRSKKRKSEASRAARRKQDALQHQRKRASESEMERIIRKSKDARRFRERQTKQRERRRPKKVSETEQETLGQQTRQRQYRHQSKKRKSEASTRCEQDSLQHRRKRASESEMASTSRKSKDARRIPFYKTVPRADHLSMKKGRSVITEQILNLTLEILYLLTGEDYIIVKKSGRPTTHNKRFQVVEGICRTLGKGLRTPPYPVAPQDDNEQKILELTNKITELLTGEVPIRCQDVTVHFNMEEWEYLKGHKELYKDILMENHQNIVLPDGPICRNSLFHNVPSDLVNEDDMTMDTESRTESVKVHNPIDMQIISSGIITEKTSGYKNGNLCDSEHKHDSSIQIKEEPCDVSWDGGNLPNMTTRSAVQLHSIHIKEELVSYDGDSLTDPNSYTPTDHSQHHPSHILDEQTSCGRQNLTQPDFYTFTDPSPYRSIHNIETPISHGTCNLRISNICTLADHTHQSPSHIMEETASSNKEDLNYTNLPTQYLPIRIKEEPVAYEDHIDTKTCRYPTQQSTSILVMQEGTSSCNGRNLTVMEPSVIATISDDPKADVDNEEYSSSVYSVRQSANTVEILYHCPSCHEGFSSNLDLARHQVNHTVDKLFMCSLCGKSFTELSFLVKHQVIHTDLKLCVCPVCGGCFYSETSLAKHQKSHSSPMYCARCSKCFFDKTELEIHMEKHTGQRPYVCHMCRIQFTSKSVLDKHMLSHTQAEQSK